MDPLLAVGLVLILAAAALVLSARSVARRDAAFRRDAVRVDGRIVALDGEDDDMPTVEYVTADGVTRRVEGGSNTSSEVGATMVVYYLEGPAGEARLADDMTGSVVVRILIGIVLVFMGLGMLVTSLVSGG